MPSTPHRVEFFAAVLSVMTL